MVNYKFILLKTIIYYIFFLFVLSIYGQEIDEKLTNHLDGRYLFIEYYFHPHNGLPEYVVSSKNNNTIWLIRNDSIFEEYYIKSSQKNDTLTDFVDALRFIKENKFIMFDNLESFYVKKRDTLILENKSFRYSMIKLN